MLQFNVQIINKEHTSRLLKMLTNKGNTDIRRYKPMIKKIVECRNCC